MACATGLCLFWHHPSASAQPCVECHADLTADKTEHAAVSMGCESCHSAIDAADIPHAKRNTLPKGLSAEQPDLCYGCHDQALFTKPNVHAALFTGCTSCHDPHAGRNPKLLSSPQPDLCFGCHDRAAFTKKNIHAPVAAGQCTTCHSPHAGDHARLLTSPVPDLCVMCHDRQGAGHVLAGQGLGAHPVAGRPDPSRPGKDLTCASCHLPHSSSGAFLSAGTGAREGGLCSVCHVKIMVR